MEPSTQSIKSVEPLEAAHRDAQLVEPVIVRETVPRRLPGTQLGSVVRIAFGIVWLIDAGLKWLPAFQNRLFDVVHDGGANQPGWLSPWFRFHEAIIAAQPRGWAIAIALGETLIGLLLVLGLARKLTYLFGAIWSLGIWSTAEGFGHPTAGMPWTDIGTAIMYVFIFLALVALDAEAGKRQTGTRSYSLDALIERRRPTWRFVAEVKR